MILRWTAGALQRARSASAMSADSFFPRARDSLSNFDGGLALAPLQETNISVMDAGGFG